MIRQALFRTFMRGIETTAKGFVVGSETGQVGIYSQGEEWESVDKKLLPNGYLLEPTEWPKGVRPPVEFEERPRDCSPGHAGKEGLHLAMTEASRGLTALC